MADFQRKSKIRVRKTAPTIRERLEAKQSSDSEPKKARLKFIKRPRSLASSRVMQARPVKLLGKILGFLAPRYFINSWREVRQVTWPTGKETRRLTLAVFTFAIVFGAMVAAVDKGLDEFFKRVILK